MSCEDWPCCGHEAGCCPDFNEFGQQLNMKCTCGATVPLSSRSSLCENCLRGCGEDDYYDDDPYYYEDENEDYPYDEPYYSDEGRYNDD